MGTTVDLKAGQSIIAIVQNATAFVVYPPYATPKVPADYLNPVVYQITVERSCTVEVGEFDCPFHLYLADVTWVAYGAMVNNLDKCPTL